MYSKYMLALQWAPDLNNVRPKDSPEGGWEAEQNGKWLFGDGIQYKYYIK